MLEKWGSRKQKKEKKRHWTYIEIELALGQLSNWIRPIFPPQFENLFIGDKYVANWSHQVAAAASTQSNEAVGRVGCWMLDEGLQNA